MCAQHLCFLCGQEMLGERFHQVCVVQEEDLARMIDYQNDDIADKRRIEYLLAMWVGAIRRQGKLGRVGFGKLPCAADMLPPDCCDAPGYYEDY